MAKRFSALKTTANRSSASFIKRIIACLLYGKFYKLVTFYAYITVAVTVSGRNNWMIN